MDESGNGQEYKKWPAARVAKLRKLWPYHSASTIAELLGLTRNAIIGKASRLALQCKKQPARKPREARFIPQPTPPALPAPIVMDQPPSLNLTIETVGAEQCRYPHGEAAPFLFCGQAVQAGSSYCPYHHRLCKYPVSPARRELTQPLSPWRGVR